ncbi:hypothetical protein SS50377_20590 [Spironucleus salmonicida]|uniref:Uncharacterized protein n=1 Tax=Spironucleus salmonicida TaxID=348837 RepID=V6LQ72_9EUKA|nr:hypothetical protein SS50377_28775 [Spironucleus salmonicida]KAH0577234.1 hypothetical protein SS50377_20585 [Spironucleus salmonicida]KAH0577239.1 hypothetical protein SS50377_20590 [Spironucleus salmonicida]|eukprot:EST45861.1 Hypothetical protein SS50377_14147 [Spironucleus salmonicida]
MNKLGTDKALLKHVENLEKLLAVRTMELQKSRQVQAECSAENKHMKSRLQVLQAKLDQAYVNGDIQPEETIDACWKIIQWMGQQ